MCYQVTNPHPPRFMKDSIIKKILNESSKYNLCAMKFQYRGEPLIDDRLEHYIKEAKDIGVIETTINTNGTLLDKERSKQLIQSGLDKIIFSIDGYEPTHYNKFRTGVDFNKLVKNIKEFHRIRKKLDSKTPYISARITISNDTPEGYLKRYTEYWNQYADQIVSGEYMDFNKDNEDYRVFNDWNCLQIWQRLVVLWNGDVLPCCGAGHGNDVYGVLGNIDNESLHNMWTGNKINKIRELHKQGNSHKIHMCRICPVRRLL